LDIEDAFLSEKEMPGRPEGPEGILGRLVGKESITYKRWVADGIVHGPRGVNGEPTDLDAVEIGAAAALLTTLGDEDGRTAWRQVSERILQIKPTDALRVVWREPYETILCANDAEVGRAASGNGRPIQVIDVGSASLEARRRLRLHG
jgi:hypothetical protein